MSKRYFGVVLFGFGRAGQIHFHNLRNSPKAEILYIVEEYPDKAQETIEEYRLKDIKIISPGDSAVALQDDRVQAVVVATPTFTHQKIVTEAVAAGKAVFCEKPIAQTLEDTRKCYAAAEKNGVLLQCGLNRRYDPSIRNVYDQLHNGNIGKLHLVKTTARDHRLTTQLSYLASSGGLFNDCAVHDLDMVCWLVGEFPSEIHVFGNANEPEIKAMNDADTAVITLKFPCGVIAVIDIRPGADFCVFQVKPAFYLLQNHTKYVCSIPQYFVIFNTILSVNISNFRAIGVLVPEIRGLEHPKIGNFLAF